MEVIMTRQDVFYKDREYISHTYQRFPVAIISFHLQKGSGMWRRTIGGNCRRQLIILYAESWLSLCRVKAAWLP